MGMNYGHLTESQIKDMLGDLVDNEIPKARKVKFPELEPQENKGGKLDIFFLSDVKVDLVVELGRSNRTVGDILQLEPGSVIELDKIAGEEVEVYLNEEEFASAEVVIINEAFGIRLNSFLSDDSEE